MLDICACLITLLQDHPHLVTAVLELGLVRKMREILESHNPASNVYELALLVLCGVLRCPNALCRTVVLASGPAESSTTGYGHGGGFCAPSCGGGRGASQQKAQQGTVAPSSSSSNSGNNMNSFSFGAGVVAPLGGFHFGAAEDEDANMVDGAEEEGGASSQLPAVPPHSVLGHVVRHLGRTENPLTRSDICRSLLCVVDMGVRYAEVCVQCGLEGTLGRLMALDAFDLKVDAGKGLTDIFGIIFPAASAFSNWNHA